MKKLHLLCNAHLDPVWLWQRNEGLAEAISTFRVAADFCENYDGFVFNHNEALLYEWIEEYEPALFERIKKLVKEKKWVIMGGWYLQPDCTMLSGESFLSQIRLGQDYFMEKFGVKPTTAVNVDPFGHTRGLVQIMKKCGYDGYIFMRPEKMRGEFVWEGYDGSQVLAHGLYGNYGTRKGEALKKVEGYIGTQEREVGLCLWGIGNHGGGPSKIDLETINEFIRKSDVEIIHSSADAYMAEIDRDKLTVVDKFLGPYFVGCYTSMIRVKQANRRLENKIALTEKAMSYANMTNADANELKSAKKALAFCQFHDILPGTAIKSVEKDSLQTFSYGEEIADKLYTKAFFKLCAGQVKAKDGEVPIMVFNPHPYEIEGEFEVEFVLQIQNWTEGEFTVATVYDKDGNALPTQNEKPQCSFHLDWPKKISFRAKLAPSSVSRFDCRFSVIKEEIFRNFDNDGEYITVENDKMKVRISRKSGLIDLYEVDGKKYIKGSGKIEVYKDDENPWGMKIEAFDEYVGEFKLMSDEEANAFVGYPEEKITNVRIVEDGEVRIKVQAFFEYKRSTAVIEYTIPKRGKYIDVNINMVSAEPNRMIKYKLETKLNGVPYGDTAFGVEMLPADNKETTYQKWCGIKDNEACLYVINKGIYGGSFTDNTIQLSLLRTPVYAAHPILDRALVPHNRFLEHMDIGEREFSFRITTEKDIARQAQIYNEEPRLLSFFPSGDGEKRDSVVAIDNPDVILSSLRTNGDKYELTLYNASETENDAEITIHNKVLREHFGKYEFKILDISF